MAQSIRKQLIVFDFDWSFVDQDTDRWVAEVLDCRIRRKMEDLEPRMQWTDIVTQSLIDLHAAGFTRKQIEDALRILPMASSFSFSQKKSDDLISNCQHPAMIRAVTNLRNTSTEIRFYILSNSNAVYITTILEHWKLTQIFHEITTNPAEWDPSGLLKVRRRIPVDGPQHSCVVGCSPNMCKGEELEEYLSRWPEGFDRIVYIGDGSNDYCPIIRLRSQDMALVRRHRGLERRIAKEGGVQCSVKYWDGAWEIEEIFTAL